MVRVTGTVECFDPSTDQWTDKPSMMNARKFAGAAVASGKVFVVGGFGDIKFNTLQGSCEVFDPVLDQWSLVSSPVIPRAACAMVSFDGHLYLFGGNPLIKRKPVRVGLNLIVLSVMMLKKTNGNYFVPCQKSLFVLKLQCCYYQKNLYLSYLNKFSLLIKCPFCLNNSY